MNRQQLAHLLRAASAIANDGEVLVLGSQSILGSFDEDDLPSSATFSAEADLAFLRDQGRLKADLIDGAIGEDSGFHGMYGVYAEGVTTDVAVLPSGWRDRLVSWSLQSSEPARPLFLDPYDCVCAKLVRGSAKDLEFTGALLGAGVIDKDLLLARVELFEDAAVRDRVRNTASSFRGGWAAPRIELEVESAPMVLRGSGARCGARTEDGSPCRNPAGSCPHH